MDIHTHRDRNVRPCARNLGRLFSCFRIGVKVAAVVAATCWRLSASRKPERLLVKGKRFQRKEEENGIKMANLEARNMLHSTLILFHVSTTVTHTTTHNRLISAQHKSLIINFRSLSAFPQSTFPIYEH